MEIFNKLGQAAREASYLTGMAIEAGRLKLKIHRKQEEIKREKQKIGEIMWNKFNANEGVSADVAERCEKIRDHCAAIEILDNAVDAIKSQMRDDDECCCCEECPDCGTLEPCGANFCSNCGTKLGEEDECDCCDCCDSDDIKDTEGNAE